MYERIIQYATPAFFALIALELAWGRARGRVPYRLNDALTSIGLGVFSQVAGAFARVIVFGAYLFAWEHGALFAWPEPWTQAWWALPAALVFYDFCYYWHHRWMHEIAVAWAAHVVHHSSEDYNLSTALRQTATGPLLGWIPYLPMAIAGVPPSLFLAVALIDLLYQFWIHTELVGRLGWFDRVFASPSNHRVHHAVNDRYLDRNYGGILIVWDRLFGTFQDELPDEPPVYGTRKPLRSFDPLWANLEVYAQLARASARAPRWRDRLAVWVRRPGWSPPGAGAAAGRPRTAHGAAGDARYDPPASPAMRAYAALQFVLLLAMAVHFSPYQRGAPPAEALAYATLIALALVGVGAALQERRALLRLEFARHGATIAGVVVTGGWFGAASLAAPVRWAIVCATLVSVAVLVRALRAPAATSPAPA